MSQNPSQGFAHQHDHTHDGGIRVKHSKISMLKRLSPEDQKFLCEAENSTGEMLKNCALAVLRGDETDEIITDKYPDFKLEVAPYGAGVEIILHNPPQEAFVDGGIEEARREMLFDVLRDIVFTRRHLSEAFDSRGISDAVYKITDNANIFEENETNYDPIRFVCWGSHSSSDYEYNFSKHFGYTASKFKAEMITGCGPGVMKGTMKGAVLGHKQQRIQAINIGFTEPGIISSESPNPVVDRLVIYPDIEKRLEAFVRTGTAIIVFPGGAGTAEEIMYIMSILLHPKNQDIQVPLIFTGPASSKSYFDAIDNFIRKTLGEDALKLRTRIVADETEDLEEIPEDAHSEESDRIKAENKKKQWSADKLNAEKAAYFAVESARIVKQERKKNQQDRMYNRELYIPPYLQQRFNPTHENVESLELQHMEDKSQLASNLRSAFSAIVAGNVKADGIAAVKEHGPYKLRGEKDIMTELSALLLSFIKQGRMRIGVSPDKYEPIHECYDLEGNLIDTTQAAA